MKNICILILTIICITSCKKSNEIQVCTKNCKSISLKGRVYDISNNNAFANTPIKLQWEYFRYCVFCSRNPIKVYEGSTDYNGNFTIMTSIDTSLSNDYALKLILPEKENYIKIFSGYIEDTTINNNIEIKAYYYPTTDLRINLYRKQNDSIEWIELNYYWHLTNSNDYLSRGHILHTNKDTSYTIKTAIDIPTFVTFRKVRPSGGYAIDIRDSIICRKNSNNTLNFDY